MTHFRRNPRGSKRKNQARHALRRAAERYHLDLREHDLCEIVRAIQRSQFEGDQPRFVWRESCRLSHWDVKVKGVWCRVVYDKERQMVCTFLPSHTLEPKPYLQEDIRE